MFSMAVRSNLITGSIDMQKAYQDAAVVKNKGKIA